MTPNRIPLLVPQLPTVDALLPYLRRIDESRWYSNFGPLVRELEARLAKSFEPDNSQPLYVATVSNATVGLELALLACQLPPGSRVLIPALTFVASATAIERAGHTPVVSDVDPENWLLTPDIAQEVCKSTSIDAVMPVATFGVPVDTTAWCAFSQKKGIPVIVDAAAAFGNQQHLGNLMAVYSLHATKPLAAGEGGMVVCASREMVERVRRLSNFGINLGDLDDVPFGTVPMSGTNAKMSEYHAAIGLASLDQWLDTAAQRRKLFQAYWHQLQCDLGPERISIQKNSMNIVRATMCIEFTEAVMCAKAKEALRIAQIESRAWYCPLIHQHQAFSHCTNPKGTPVAEKISARLLGLPFYPSLQAAEIERVCQTLRQVF